MTGRKRRKPMQVARARGRVPQQALPSTPFMPPIYDQLVKELGDPSGKQKV